IPTLPNLETKFVAANSLIAKKKQASHCLFENPDIEPTKQKLIEVRHEHFSAKTANRKSTLREKDKVLREKLARLLADDKDFAPEDAIQLAAWNPYDQNTVAEFFDPAWMFGVSDGFDIVIGNPPYIQLQNNGGELAKLYEPCDYKTFAKTGDIYCLFYERGWQLLKPKGHLCYITSNKWMRAGYGEKTRGFFAKNTNPQLLIDFAGVKIFESATVDTNILLFSKEDNKHKTLCAATNKQNKDGVKNLSVFVQHSGAVCDFSSSDSWVILSPIEQSIKRKIEAVGTPLKDWDIQINYGIKTGYNDAFIIDTEKREAILANCQTE
ncbi:eco57I restriction-modification methylase family protein, partial [Bacteroides fragilis str. 3783N2-1]